MTATMTACKNEWVIRPTMASGTRRYVAVAKLADGSEVLIYDGPCSFASVKAARLHIIRKFDGGRRFPSAPTPAREMTQLDWDRVEETRRQYRGY